MKKVIGIGIAVTLLLILMPSAVSANTYEVSASPIVEANVVGEEHTVTVTISQALGTEDSAEVVFYVEQGPNEGEGDTVGLGEGESEASFTYQSNGLSGLDVISIGVEINEVPYEIPIEVNEEQYPLNTVYKIWLTDKFSGGGQILEESGDKKKDFYKISWGGWAGTVDLGGAFTIGAFEVTFHNVSDDDLDKTKFVSEDEELGITELYLDYGNETGFSPAYPPESVYNAVEVWVEGDLFDKHGDPIAGDWAMGIYAVDAGEPGVEDAIAFDLYDGYILVYSSYASDFQPTGDYSPVDSGNLQIVVPPAIGPVVLFEEDFTGLASGEIPAGWVRDPPDETDKHWAPRATSAAGGSSPEMEFDDYPYVSATFRLVSPEIDATAYIDIELTFKHFVSHYNTPYTLKVQVSTDDGTTWTDAWSISPTGNIGPETVTVDLSDYDELAFKIAWVFDGYSYNINYWRIDDISVTGN